MHHSAPLFRARCPIGQHPPYFTPQPLLSCPPAILPLLLSLPLCAVDVMETSLQKRERSSHYLLEDVFTEEQPSLRRQGAESCKDLTRPKANVGEACEQSREVDVQSSATIYEKHFSNRLQTLLTFILGAKTTIPLATRSPPPPSIPTSYFSLQQMLYT